MAVGGMDALGLMMHFVLWCMFIRLYSPIMCGKITNKTQTQYNNFKYNTFQKCITASGLNSVRLETVLFEDRKSLSI